MNPPALEQLLGIILKSHETKGEIFDVPEKLFYKHWHFQNLYIEKYGQRIHNPIGISAGPHTQLAQNIVSGWLCGARFIDLKTVHPNIIEGRVKPSIDIFDGAFNSEKSHELSVEDAYDQFLNAWIIIHILQHKLFIDAHKFKAIGTIFNMSLGYTLADIRSEKMQWFIDKMMNCSVEKAIKLNQIKQLYPKIDKINIPDRISESFIITTCRGCSVRELEYICKFLIIDKKLHPIIKLSPTLLGYKSVAAILNNENSWDVEVSEDDFLDTIQYGEAISLIENVMENTREIGLDLTVKISNSLTCKNTTSQIPGISTEVFLSGKVLHPIAVNLAAKIQSKFEGRLDISFSGGANCFNTPNLLQSGFSSVSVCTDLLKPGGYGRLNQYFTELSKLFVNYQAKNIREFILKSGNEYGVQESALGNLRNYAIRTLNEPAYQKNELSGTKFKSDRPLLHYDCIVAPCTQASPLNIRTADYCYFTAKNNAEKAINTILADNALPSILGMAGDDTSRLVCTRQGYDYPVLMKEIERFIADLEPGKNEGFAKLPNHKHEVAIVGGGISGLACAWYLTMYGFSVDIYEAEKNAGGMIHKMVPGFRISASAILKDIQRIKNAGVKILYSTQIDKERFDRIRKTYSFVYVATGAQEAAKLELENAHVEGVMDVKTFLTQVKSSTFYKTGKNIAVIGNDWLAADAARAASRIAGVDGYVALILQETRNDLNVGHQIKKAIIDEDIEIFENCRLKKINAVEERLDSLEVIDVEIVKSSRSKNIKYQDIAGSEQTYKFDLLVYCGQRKAHPGFVDLKNIKGTENSRATKLNFVYAGGAVINPDASIMQAMADAKLAAQEIATLTGVEIPENLNVHKKHVDLNQLKIKRTQIEKPYFPESVLPEQRVDFKPVLSTFKPVRAIKEAGRCLQCDVLCNVCVNVCPNHAMLGFEINPDDLKIPVVTLNNEDFFVSYLEKLPITQKHQVLTVADWCNQCGNCATFCPSAGVPYKDKIRLHFSHETFNQDTEGLLVVRNGKYYDVTLKKDGNLAMLTENWDALIFENDDCMAVLDKATFNIQQVTIFDDAIQILSIPEITEIKMLLKVVKDLV